MLRVAVCLALVISAGCSAPFATTSGAPSALPFERLRPEPSPYTYRSGLSDSTRAVIRDRGTWSDMWAQVHASSWPEPPPLDEIDFGREMVVVAALGARGSGGYSIVIEDVFDRGDHIVVAVVRGEPGQRCLTTAALTSPADVVRLQRDERPVLFTERRVVAACD